jgi:hypothetical protein
LNKLIKISAVAGLAGGVFCQIFFQILLHFSGENPLGPTGIRVLDFWVPGLSIGFAFWYLKQTRLNRAFHIWEGFLMGILITVILAVTSATCLAIYLHLFGAPVLTDYINKSVIYLSKIKDFTVKNLGEAIYLKQMEAIRNIKTADIWFYECKDKFIYGIFVVPVASIIFRKQDLKEI